MNRVSKWAILLFSLSLVVSCGTNRPGAITDPTTTDDPSQPVDTSDPSGTTDPADPSNTGTACESDTDCAPGICGEDGTCQPRDLACSSDADCYEDEYCAFPSGSSYDPAVAGVCTPGCTGPEGCPLGQECICLLYTSDAADE